MCLEEARRTFIHSCSLNFITGSESPFYDLSFNGKPTPTFADLDGDVYLDLLVEDGAGNLTLFEDFKPKENRFNNNNINLNILTVLRRILICIRNSSEFGDWGDCF